MCTRRYYWFWSAVALLALACGVSCSDSPKQKSKGDASAGGTGTATAAATSTSVAGTTTAGTGTGTASGGDGGGTGDGGTGGDTAAADAAVKQLLADCGGGAITSAKPDDVIYQKTLTSLPISKTVLIVQVNLSSTLDVKVTGATTTETSTVTVTSVTGLFSDLAKTQAQQQAAAASGTATFANVPFADYVKLSQNKAWTGVLCTFVPVTKVENDRGGHKTVAEFDPPLPNSVSPKASSARYDTEIGDKKVFDGMTVKIDSSDNPDLAGRTSLTGTVTVEKVAPTASVDDGKGGQFQIQADRAYKVTYDFGSPAATAALGLANVVTFYISYARKDLVANVVDTSSANGALVTFPNPP